MVVAGVTIGLREAVIALIVLVALYMLFVLLRVRRIRPPMEERLDGPAAPEAQEEIAAISPGLLSAGNRYDEADQAAPGNSPAVLAEHVLNQGLAREVVQLREEVDAVRGELAALREDMLREIGHLRATQTVSPIYGDAMQMAVAGYDAAMIAERCGIARAEAELVAALAKSQEH